jgi:hypothetical protein
LSDSAFANGRGGRAAGDSGIDAASMTFALGHSRRP